MVSLSRSFYSIDSTGNCVVSTCLERPIAEVHSDNTMHDAKKSTANHAVMVLSTSAVDVPNTDSLAAPPKAVPMPELLLSWMRMTKQRTMLSSTNSVIAAKYRNDPIKFPLQLTL